VLTIFGGVDSALILKRSDHHYTLQSRQRYGTDFPEIVLQFDKETRSLSLGPEKYEADIQVVDQRILEYLEARGAKTESEIDQSVEGKTGTKRKALRSLVEQGKVSRNGTGTRGDPFTYQLVFPGSPYASGTRERETDNSPERHKNTVDTPVPAIPQSSILVPQGLGDEDPMEEGEL
jgi:hypothetical protein